MPSLDCICWPTPLACASSATSSRASACGLPQCKLSSRGRRALRLEEASSARGALSTSPFPVKPLSCGAQALEAELCAVEGGDAERARPSRPLSRSRQAAEIRCATTSATFGDVAPRLHRYVHRALPRPSRPRGGLSLTSSRRCRRAVSERGGSGSRGLRAAPMGEVEGAARRCTSLGEEGRGARRRGCAGAGRGGRARFGGGEGVEELSRRMKMGERVEEGRRAGRRRAGWT